MSFWNTPRCTTTTTARPSSRRWTTWPPGEDVLLEIDVQGALQVRYQYPDALMIFICRRTSLRCCSGCSDRGRDSDEEIEKRFRAAKREIHMAKGSRAFDYMVINDDVDRAVEEIVKMIRQKKSPAEFKQHSSLRAQDSGGI